MSDEQTPNNCNKKKKKKKKKLILKKKSFLVLFLGGTGKGMNGKAIIEKEGKR